MKYREFGKTGLKVSALGFGTMRLPLLEDGVTVDEKEAVRIIRHAIDSGVNYVDTAYPYHQGTSEIVVGKALGDGYRDKVFLADKSPIWKLEKESDFDSILEEQLQKLQTDHIDFYLLHALNKERFEKIKNFHLIDHMLEARKAGKIRYLGFSFHDDLEVFKQIVDYTDQWDFCQIQYNYIDTQVQAGDKGSEVHYTTDGSDPTKDSPLYQAPFAFAQKGTVKAIAYDPTFDTVSPVSAQTFDIPACDYTIVSPKDEKTSLILDGNGYTTYYLPQGKQELVVQLAKEMPISGFRYTPNQGRDASGHISNYQLYINGKKVAEGEFSNIKANPIEQVVHFPITKGNQIRLVATRIVDNKKQAGIGEFSVITEK